MELARLRQRLEPWLLRLAPTGTRRWRAVRWAVRQARRLVWHLRGGLSLGTPRIDFFNREALNEFLRPFAISFPEKPNLPITPDSAVRFLLELLLAHPQLRQRFPDALTQGDAGPFSLWLDSAEARQLNIPAEAVPHLRAALADRPGDRTLQWFEHVPFLREVFPLGLTPAGWGRFLRCLLRVRGKRGLSADEVLALFFRLAMDPSQGLAATYLRTPLWQEQVPDGLGQNWDALRAWVARHHGLHGDWLDSARRPELPPEEQGQPGVNVLGHFRYPSGLQVAARNTIEALRGQGWYVSARDVPSGLNTDLPGREGYLGLHPYPLTLVHLAPEPLAEDAYPRAGLAFRPGTYRIGYWYWELEEVPASWARHASWLHELWAPTRFVADALRRTLPMPVLDMLAGMRMPPVVNVPRCELGLPGDRFLFLFVFDMASTFQRKNPLAVIEAFRRAFRPEEPAALTIKVSRGRSDPAALETLRRACGEAGVYLIDAFLPEQQLFGLMNACDAYVSLHRSEGYGLTMAEAMALGKPVVATGYSGNLDFMTSENSLLVDYQLVPLTRTEHLYRRGGKSAEPSIDHAAALMRRLYEHRDWGRALGERARQDVQARLSLEAAGRRMAARLGELLHGRARKVA